MPIPEVIRKRVYEVARVPRAWAHPIPARLLGALYFAEFGTSCVPSELENLARWLGGALPEAPVLYGPPRLPARLDRDHVLSLVGSDHAPGRLHKIVSACPNTIEIDTTALECEALASLAREPYPRSAARQSFLRMFARGLRAWDAPRTND